MDMKVGVLHVRSHGYMSSVLGWTEHSYTVVEGTVASGRNCWDASGVHCPESLYGFASSCDVLQAAMLCLLEIQKSLQAKIVSKMPNKCWADGLGEMEVDARCERRLGEMTGNVCLFV